MKERKRNLAAIGVLAAVYFVTGKMGLSLAFIHPSSTPIWPPTGLALAAFLLLGYRVWPGIMLGAFFVNLTTLGTAATSLGVATGNTLEGLLGAYLVNRWARGTKCFEHFQDTFKFAIFAGTLSTAVSATLGVTSLSVGGFASWADYGPIWLTWWLGDGVGAVVVAPLLILWSSDHRRHWNWPWLAHYVALMAGLFLVAEIIFGGLVLHHPTNYPLEYLCIPFLIWAAYRFGQREAATATIMLSGIAIWGTIHGLGPFVVGMPNTSLLLLQAFTGIMAVTTLAFAALCAENKHTSERFEMAIESAPTAFVMIDRKGKIVFVNSRATQMFGYERSELVGQLVEVLVPERFRSQHASHRGDFSARPQARAMGVGRDLYAVRKDGSEFPVEIGLNPIGTEEGSLVLSAIVDISERKRTEEEILRLATTDPMTGLANYRKLINVLDAEIKRSERTGRPFAVVLLDLDGLKKINDQHGHVVGSQALCRLAEVLRIHCREVDTAARYGGDEFAVVITEADANSAAEFAHRILNQVANDAENPPLTVSAGVSMYPQDGETIEKLLSAADKYLYEMKRPSRTEITAQPQTTPAE